MYEYDEEKLKKERMEKRIEKILSIVLFCVPLLIRNFLITLPIQLSILGYWLYKAFVEIRLKRMAKKNIEKKEESWIKKSFIAEKIISTLFVILATYFVFLSLEIPRKIRAVTETEKIIKNTETFYAKGEKIDNSGEIKKWLLKEINIWKVVGNKKVGKLNGNWEENYTLVNQDNQKIGINAVSCLYMLIKLDNGLPPMVIPLELYEKPKEKELCKSITGMKE